MASDNLTTLIMLGGVGVVGYRAYKGEWPWQAEWFPGGKPEKLPQTEAKCKEQGYYWYEGACHTSPPPTKPAPELTVTSTDLPETVTVGEAYTVTATVENEGGAEGTGTVRFTMNGTPLRKEEITVPARGSKQVSIKVTPENSGTDRICVEAD